MYLLSGKRVLLCVGGGIAAYKSAELVRRLVGAGAEVQVAMTAAAREFITPLTLQTLSRRPVATNLFDAGEEAAIGHIEVADWADVVLV
ncbi:MAG: phosphopantothenoylcysteine decarboxylase/phosphopantothenate--cysteine ligase, partial [Candidatus Binatia bacterium]